MPRLIFEENGKPLPFVRSEGSASERLLFAMMNTEHPVLQVLRKIATTQLQAALDEVSQHTDIARRFEQSGAAGLVLTGGSRLPGTIRSSNDLDGSIVGFSQTDIAYDEDAARDASARLCVEAAEQMGCDILEAGIRTMKPTGRPWDSSRKGKKYGTAFREIIFEKGLQFFLFEKRFSREDITHIINTPELHRAFELTPQDIDWLTRAFDPELMRHIIELRRGNCDNPKHYHELLARSLTYHYGGSWMQRGDELPDNEATIAREYAAIADDIDHISCVTTLDLASRTPYLTARPMSSNRADDVHLTDLRDQEGFAGVLFYHPCYEVARKLIVATDYAAYLNLPRSNEELAKHLLDIYIWSQGAEHMLSVDEKVYQARAHGFPHISLDHQGILAVFQNQQDGQAQRAIKMMREARVQNTSLVSRIAEGLRQLSESGKVSLELDEIATLSERLNTMFHHAIHSLYDQVAHPAAVSSAHEEHQDWRLCDLPKQGPNGDARQSPGV